MPTQDIFHLESRLAAYLNGLIRTRLNCFIKNHPNHPIVREIFARNLFYAKILVCARLGQEPQPSEFEKLFGNADPDVLYQDGLYLYGKWKAMGTDDAIFNYCQLINRILDRIPPEEMGIGKFADTDFCNEEDVIRNFFYVLMREKSDGEPKIEKAKKSHRFLAVNA